MLEGQASSIRTVPDRTATDAHATVSLSPLLPASPQGEDPVSTVIGLIYEAGMAPERWPEALGRLADLFGSAAAALHVGEAGVPARITMAYGLSEEAVRGYGGCYNALDPVTPALLAGAAWKAPATLRQISPALERTRFFTDWMRPHGMEDGLCLGLCPPDRPQQATLRLLRPRRATRFGPPESALLMRLAPHLRRAAEMHHRLASPHARPDGPLVEILNRLACGLMLADSRGALIWANRAASRMLEEADGIGTERQGNLRAGSPGMTRLLRDLVNRAALGQHAALPLPRASGKVSLALQAMPITVREVERHRQVLPASPRASVLLLLTDPARGAMPTPEICQQLREIYGLTTAEAGVAAWAAQGIGLPEVGQILGITVNTVRTHVRRVFHKTGVRSQAELARQVERLAPLLAEEGPGRGAERPAAGSGLPRARAPWPAVGSLRDSSPGT
ncbi:LuxR C-terminal-related transcriptional regulator [Roseomonas gilardii subsp. gilardii]|uniref:helix-turn-helix transcriptional regulator n=1 Tax=Roseomonas gilardii TaxID=257708 RepID=UPI001FF9B7B2|nr:LuxR C-terminal-related transcriptional regulator [Roseomonas gilardii]UPG73910.1 LuxR C-terminal-related transcriptional regulator [Roseomonas gilardii subsp. gilardii]